MNNFSYLFLAFLAAGAALQWYLGRRHIRHIQAHRDTVPTAFSDKISLPEHQKAADYCSAKTAVGVFGGIIATLLLLLWTYGGLLELVDQTIRASGLSGLWSGTVFMLAVIVIAAILQLPLDLYHTFGLEQRFGFNKMTPGLFITDLLKNTALLLLIAPPLLLLVLWLMTNAGQYWWVYVWLTWLGFSLFMMWAYPAFIAPLFNKFRPLQDTDLKTRIENLLTRNGFASNGIFVMDGSARSTHGNAYFAGLGANKRIVFFDTLIDDLSHEEIEAVLAHELGHFKCNHIKKRIVVLGVLFLLGFAILGYLAGQDWFYHGLGVSTASSYMALTLFFMVAPVFSFALQPIFSGISRQHEFEADDFAAQQAQTAMLIQALVKLYRENANTLTPDPLYSAYYDSHPPAPVRIAHLNATQTAPG
ncbi:MAG: M48 family metallopeptidase [Gammaproteobacteria bacterium]